MYTDDATVDSGYSGSSHGSFTSTSSTAASPDFQQASPRINRMLDSIGATRQQLHQLWQLKKMKLEQCLQLRLFEQDCRKVGVKYRHINPAEDSSSIV